MSIQAVGWVLTQGIETSSKFVLVALANYADENGKCWPSQARLAKDTSMAERTVRKHLKLLEEAGYITRVKRRRKDGFQDSDLFEIHTESSRKSVPVKENPGGTSRPNQPEYEGKTRRHQIPGNRHTKPSVEPSDSLSVPKRTDPAPKENNYSPDFEYLWHVLRTNQLWHKTPLGSKFKAHEEWKDAGRPSAADIQSVWRKYHAECVATDTNTQHLERWIKKRRWEDEYDPPAQTVSAAFV